jgi:hypothetical protein
MESQFQQTCTSRAFNTEVEFRQALLTQNARGSAALDHFTSRPTFNLVIASIGRFAQMLNHDEIPYRKKYIPRQAINYLDNRLIQRLVGNQSSASLHLKR